jgi:hypothetical protein
MPTNRCAGPHNKQTVRSATSTPSIVTIEPGHIVTSRNRASRFPSVCALHLTCAHSFTKKSTRKAYRWINGFNGVKISKNAFFLPRASLPAQKNASEKQVSSRTRYGERRRILVDRCAKEGREPASIIAISECCPVETFQKMRSEVVIARPHPGPLLGERDGVRADNSLTKSRSPPKISTKLANVLLISGNRGIRRKTRHPICKELMFWYTIRSIPDICLHRVVLESLYLRIRTFRHIECSRQVSSVVSRSQGWKQTL